VLGVKPTAVEIEADGRRRYSRRRTQRVEIQRYMQDYLACIQSVDDNVGGCSTGSTRTG